MEQISDFNINNDVDMTRKGLGSYLWFCQAPFVAITQVGTWYVLGAKVLHLLGTSTMDAPVA